MNEKDSDPKRPSLSPNRLNYVIYYSFINNIFYTIYSRTSIIRHTGGSANAGLLRSLKKTYLNKEICQ